MRWSWDLRRLWKTVMTIRAVISSGPPRMLAEELRTRGLYKKQLTGDYIKNLVMAAPMHDVGKIAIPDAILQKPGKLTSEEFDIMKTMRRGAEKSSGKHLDIWGMMNTKKWRMKWPGF